MLILHGMLLVLAQEPDPQMSACVDFTTKVEESPAGVKLRAEMRGFQQQAIRASETCSYNGVEAWQDHYSLVTSYEEETKKVGARPCWLNMKLTYKKVVVNIDRLVPIAVAPFCTAQERKELRDELQAARDHGLALSEERRAAVEEAKR